MQSKTLFAIRFLILLALLSPRFAKAQGYWIYDGHNLVKDERGDPETAKATEWSVWLYKNGRPTGGKDNWGAIDGNTASEVMRKLKDAQAFELRFNKWAGKGAVPDEIDTYFNPLGPIARIERQSTAQKQATTVVDSLPTSTLTRYKKSYQQVKTFRDGYQQIARVVNEKTSDPNPLAMVGVEVKEYSESLRDASEKLSKLRSMLESINSPQLEVFNEQLDYLDSDLSRLQEKAPIIAQGLGIPAGEFAPLAANSQPAANSEDLSGVSAYERQMKVLADELMQASLTLDPNDPGKYLQKLKGVFRKIAALEESQPNTDARSKELADLLKRSLDSDDPVQMMQAITRMMEIIPQPQ